MKKLIREVEKLEDFKKVYRVFSEEPYYEKYTEEELKEIFEGYKKNGFIYGAYTKEECIGIVAFEKGVKENQPVQFKEEKMMYLADVAVLDRYRKTGLGTQLMLFAVMQSKELGYEKLYMRTLEPKKSMSYGIAKKIGFKEIPNVFQEVKMERMDGSITGMKNIFLEMDLRSLDKKLVKKSIENSYDKKERER